MRNIRNTYSKPKVPWNSAQIKEDKVIMKQYGLRRKKELWKSQEVLRNYRERARKLIAANNPRKEGILIDKMVKLGLLKKDMGLDDILALDVHNILDRRLQSVIKQKGITGNIKTARQYIVHGHVLLDDRRMKFPSYLVSIDEENKLKLHPNSKNLAEKPAPKKENIKKIEMPVETAEEKKEEKPAEKVESKEV